MMATRQRSALLLWLGGIGFILVSLASIVVAPFRSCPDCEGAGIELVGKVGEERVACERCLGEGRLSLLRKWTTKPKMTYVGAVNAGSFGFIRALLDREKIPIIPGDSSLGIVGFYSDSPANALRARKLIQRDAQLKGYTFR